MNTSADAVFDVTFDIQSRWLNGTLSRYEMVNDFLEQLVPRGEFSTLEPFLPRLNIIVTTASDGALTENAADYDTLVDLLVRTTWIPMVTGKGILREGREMYLDGGFSRTIHPPCDSTVRVPITWSTFVNTLNPGFGLETALQLFQMGREATAAEVGLKETKAA